MAHPSASRSKFLALLVAVALGVCGWLSFTPSGRKLCCSSVYKTFTSSDQRFQVAVFRIGSPWRMSPGASADAPGFVQLQTQDGTVLQETSIEAVQLVDQVHWEPRSVEIKLIAEWVLPGS